MDRVDYDIEKTIDGLRVKYIPDPQLHTHVHSKRIGEKLIIVACGHGKIPLNENFRFYESLYRILPDECEFKGKVHDIMLNKLKKSKNNFYYNPHLKKF